MNDDTQQTLEDQLIQAIKNRDEKGVRRLLEYGANVEYDDTHGNVIFVWAAKIATSNIFSLLLNFVKNIDIEDGSGNTALINCSKNIPDHREIIGQMLINRGSNPKHVDAEGRSVLWYHCDSGDSIQYLLDAGAIPNKVDYYNSRVAKNTDLMGRNIWKRLYSVDMMLAKQYSKNGIPREIWEIILLNKRLQELFVYHEEYDFDNKEILKYFAIELGIPVSEEMSRGQIANLISRHLKFGKFYNSENQKLIDQENKRDFAKLKEIGFRLGIDMNGCRKEGLRKLCEMMENPL